MPMITVLHFLTLAFVVLAWTLALVQFCALLVTLARSARATSTQPAHPMGPEHVRDGGR